MNGGTCEATPFNLHGVRASGVAVPLGNYHNERANGKPGPEFIDIRDVETAVALCVEFYRLVAKKPNPLHQFKDVIKKDFAKSKSYLRRKIQFEAREI